MHHAENSLLLRHCPIFDTDKSRPDYSKNTKLAVIRVLMNVSFIMLTEVSQC